MKTFDSKEPHTSAAHFWDDFIGNKGKNVLTHIFAPYKSCSKYILSMSNY